jgi:uncharacterized protein with PIN domain
MSSIVAADSDSAGRRTDDIVAALNQHPSRLLHRTNELLLRTRRVRAHAHAILEEADRLLERSSALLARSARAPGQRPDERRCPECGSRLDWVGQGGIGGVTHDYYRRCLKGCGWYAFDRVRRTWVKLA